MDNTGVRCPICLNRGWHARDGFGACTHCGLELVGGGVRGGGGDVRREIAAMLASGRVEGGRVEGGRVEGGRVEEGRAAGRCWGLNGGGWRNAAWALGHVLEGDGARPVRPVAHAVTLGAIGRAGDLPAIEALAEGFARVVAVLDGEGDGSATEVRAGLHVAVAPLGGDFAGQRNRVQAIAAGLAPEGWVLQLDTDERATARLIGALGWVTQAADRDRLRSLGLARQNLVDGVVSALYPDVQYRLNRADVRFEGRVHERPSVRFEESSLALVGDIEHRLSRARVLERSAQYEAMRPGGGRPGDERALLERFGPA